ncbi:competence protein ComQ [Paenibacillus castaneae]|uniref:polyprenyl synthetase family protein n=1 Tax=Paenibacillus castaneae TaxID=474957 RepID=UPI00141B9432|nr:polyprenyl synthetase family protein [Paenibacillus castaneae]NIK78659.1 competence protein ComQ [Paenibacillus castaneae]
MKDSIPLIEQKMRELVQQWFTAEPLVHFTELFIAEKVRESLKFGQMTIVHFRMFGGTGDHVHQAAAAVELFILASDILDDLQDQDAPAKAWMKAPQAVSIHVASSLLTLSQQAMLDCSMDNDIRVALMEMMNRQLLLAANGQMNDIMNEITDESTYLEMVKQKSAALLVFACMTGVMLAGQPWNQTVAEYAIEVGVAAQLQNDLQDLLRWDDKSDFLQRKLTLLTLYLLEGEAEEDRWINDYFQGRLSLEEAMLSRERFQEACERTGAILYGSVMSRLHYNRFEELLGTIQEASPWKATFLQIINEEIA